APIIRVGRPAPRRRDALSRLARRTLARRTLAPRIPAPRTLAPCTPAPRTSRMASSPPATLAPCTSSLCYRAAVRRWLDEEGVTLATARACRVRSPRHSTGGPDHHGAERGGPGA